MGGTQKIAISLPKELLREAERARKESGESRSAFIQRAVRVFLARRREQDAIRRYVAGYQNFPETAEEVEGAERAAQEILAQEPWE